MLLFARIPTQYKSLFEINVRPLGEMSRLHAGLLSISRAFRSLCVPGLIADHLQIEPRPCGFDEAQYVESVVMLQTGAGETGINMR